MPLFYIKVSMFCLETMWWIILTSMLIVAPSSGMVDPVFGMLALTHRNCGSLDPEYSVLLPDRNIQITGELAKEWFIFGLVLFNYCYSDSLNLSLYQLRYTLFVELAHVLPTFIKIYSITETNVSRETFSVFWKITNPWILGLDGFYCEKLN